MASKKREGWVNIYPSLGGNGIVGGYIHESKEKAVAGVLEGLIATAKIEWEE